jgi:hypothetical protein
MAWFSYSTITGEIIQISDYEIVMGNDMSISTHSLPKIALETEYMWNKELKDFVPKTGKESNLTKLGFLRKFTAAERISIREVAKVDPIIFDAIEMIDMAEYISLADPDTQNLVGYLAMQGIIVPTRVAEILG